MTIYTKETAVAEILRVKSTFPSTSKRYITALKKNKELIKFIDSEIFSRIPDFDETFVAKLWLICNNFQIICPYGNRRHYRSDLKCYVCNYECQCTKDKIMATFAKNYPEGHPTRTKENQIKRKNTMMKLYNAEFALQIPKFIDKFKNTCFKNNQVNYPFKSSKVREKSKIKSQLVYGVDYPMQNIDVQNKGKKTNLVNWGVDNCGKLKMSVYARSVLDDPIKFKELLQKYGIIYLCKLLGVCRRTIKIIHKKYNLNILRKGKSDYEIELALFLNERHIHFIGPTRKIIKPYELDLYFPDINLAIEFQGTYWHMDPRKYKSKDINKTLKQSSQEIWDKDSHKEMLCEQKGIKLIVIWEADWNSDKENIKQMILNEIIQRNQKMN